MSYDVQLCNPVTGVVLEFDKLHHMRGGTYPVGGTYSAWLNVTYNYSTHFCKVLGTNGIRGLHGMMGAESIDLLSNAIQMLGTDTDPDYWKATEGNARLALTQLLALAKMRPDGVWSIKD